MTVGFDPKKMLKRAMNAADLLGGYVDLAIDETEDLALHEIQALVEEIKVYEPQDSCEAGAKAILLHILEGL